MITLPTTPRTLPTIACDGCHTPIHFEDLVLLERSSYGLDEGPHTYHVHTACAEAFLNQEAGRWSRMPKTAIDSGWFWD